MRLLFCVLREFLCAGIAPAGFNALAVFSSEGKMKRCIAPPVIDARY